MHNDIDLIGFQDPKVGLGEWGFGGAEEYIRQLRGDHGPAPSVGYAGAQTMQNQINIVVVDPNMGAMHALHDLPVNSARLNSQFLP